MSQQDSVSAMPFIFFVPGEPAPAGSKRAIPIYNRHTGKFVVDKAGRPVIGVTDASKRSRPWKDRISALAAEAWKGPLLDEPIALTLRFIMPRPGTHFGSRRGEKYLKQCAPTWHSISPDLDKLARAAADAMTGVVFRDDCLIVAQIVTKFYGDRPGVQIRVAPAPPAEVNEVSP